MKSKKSIQLSQAFPAVLTLVLIAILVIISLYIFSALQISMPLQAANVINETYNIGTSVAAPTGAYLTNRTVCGYESPAIVTVTNVTDKIILSAGNYTFNATDSSIRNTTVIKNVLVSYSYNWRGDGCVASVNTITQFSTYPALVGLVGIIIFLALIIGVLVASFAFGRKKGV